MKFLCQFTEEVYKNELFDTKLDQKLDMVLKHHTKKRLGAIDIAAIFRRKIRTGTLAPKDRLPPGRVLSETYDVARGTIRQALKQLATEKLIEIRPGSGCYVKFDQPHGPTSVIQEASPLELIEARFAIEPHICRLATLHAKEADFRRASTLIKHMRANLNDPAAFSTADTEFHLLLAETTGNGLLKWIVHEINLVRNQDQWSRMRRLTLNPKTISEYADQHQKILNAIQARTPEEAATLMKGHLETARVSLNRTALALASI